MGKKVSVTSGYQEESRKVSTLTSNVAKVKDGWTRGDHLNTTQAHQISKLYHKISEVVASYGQLAKKDASEFEKLGVKIEVMDKQDSASMQKGGGK